MVIHFLSSMINSQIQNIYLKWQTNRWEAIYNQGLPVDPSKGSVLFWVPGGMPLMLHVEGAIAAALRLRGYKVHMIICDGCYHACILREIVDGIPHSEWPKKCPECRDQTELVLRIMSIPHSYIGEFIPEDIRDELWQQTENVSFDTIGNVCYKNNNLGKNIQSAVLRYLKGFPLAGHEEIVREFAYSALICAAAAENILNYFKPTQIFMSTGVYVDWGPALAVAYSRKIPVTAWMGSYISARFYFKNIETINNMDFHKLSNPAWINCKKLKLSEIQHKKLSEYFNTRYMKNVSFDIKKFHTFSGTKNILQDKYCRNTTHPIWAIFAHMNWDLVSDFSPMAYSSFNDWIIDTIREIINIKDVQWLVKIHPAEAWDNPDSGIQRLIETNFPKLPDHIRVIHFDEEINPLDFYNLINGGVTVYGTPGLELALQGKPVILAGEAHYGCKGFTHDGLTQESYKQLLRQASSFKPLDKDQLELAQRYAYCYFIQRQIPMPVVKNPKSSWWEFQFDKRDLLLPGKDPFMDFICEKIISGKDFVMDEKLVQLAENF